MAESLSSRPSGTPIDDNDLLSQAIPIDAYEDDEPGDSTDETPRPQADEPGATPADGTTIPPTRKIRSTEHDRGTHQTRWQRKTSNTGQGATHVKTFIAKLRPDAVQYLDDQINAWLDEHPEYEVKFATTSVGNLVGQNTEHAMFVNIWV